jgi:hypothetical protein
MNYITDVIPSMTWQDINWKNLVINVVKKKKTNKPVNGE